MASGRGAWRTRFGFYLIAIGSACGLGNLWRFPYVVGENGGGAFVLLYVLLAFIVGAPLLISELIFGKKERKSVLKATMDLSQKTGRRLAWTGRLSILMCLVVLSYYAVISGWVLHFITQFLVAAISGPEAVDGTWSVLMENGWLQWALASVHVLLTLILVAKGIHEGLERWLNSMMPLFAVLVGVLVYRTMSLPSTPDALRFLFYPDFSKLTFSSLNHAIGHVLFTLSVGFGTMVTFGSYIREEDHAATAGFRVVFVDTIVSLIAALLVFPIAFQASNAQMTDPSLLFEVLPRFLITMPGGVFFGLIFFISLYFAALNASMGLLENIVSNFVDLESPQKRDRVGAAWQAGILILILALFPALSSSVFKGLRVGGRSLIESLDAVMINWLLPLVAFFLTWAIFRGVGEKEMKKSFLAAGDAASHAMEPHWMLAIRWLIPAIVASGLILQIIGLF